MVGIVLAHPPLVLCLTRDVCVCCTRAPQARAEQLERAAAEVDQAKAEMAAVRKRQLESATGAAVGGRHVRITQRSSAWQVCNLVLQRTPGERWSMPLTGMSAQAVNSVQAIMLASTHCHRHASGCTSCADLPRLTSPCPGPFLAVAAGGTPMQMGSPYTPASGGAAAAAAAVGSAAAFGSPRGPLAPTLAAQTPGQLVATFRAQNTSFEEVVLQLADMVSGYRNLDCVRFSVCWRLTWCCQAGGC
jgi:hypothetical protein